MAKDSSPPLDGSCLLAPGRGQLAGPWCNSSGRNVSLSCMGTAVGMAGGLGRDAKGWVGHREQAALSGLTVSPPNRDEEQGSGVGGRVYLSLRECGAGPFHRGIQTSIKPNTRLCLVTV